MTTERETKLPTRRFNVDEYYKMAEIGILPWGGGYELIDGIVCLQGHGTPRRFTVDEYYKMAEAGILDWEERVELLNGEIVEMSPIGDKHAFTVDELVNLFVPLVVGRARIRCQNPVRLSSGDEPEPDVALLKLREDRYTSGHPGPDDVLLLIEVADTSLDRDRGVKLSMYAEAGIPETWIANVPERSVEAHTEPVNGIYTQSRVYRSDEAVSPIAFPDVSLLVSEILPA